jgi:hypothetical protein
VAERLPDAELWHCVERTLRDVLLPALPSDHEWARTAATQLAGLARYAATRPADPIEGRAAELRSVLAALTANPLVGELDPATGPAGLLDIAGRALAAAVGRVDEHARQVRDVLRPLLIRQLDDELAVTAPLVHAFRGRLDD